MKNLIFTLLFTLTFFGYPLATSILFVLILRFVHGLTWGSMSSAGSTIAVDLVPQKRRGEGIGIFGLSMTIAMAIGPLIAILITGDGGYNRLFFSAAAFSFFGLMLSLPPVLGLGAVGQMGDSRGRGGSLQD